MKICALIVGALLLGGTMGTAVAVQQFGWPQELAAGDLRGQNITSQGVEDDFLELPAGRTGDPKLMLNEEAFDFGTIAYGEELSHAFTFTNQGDYPLRLKVVKSTCQCTVAELPQNEVPPGGSMDVTLKFRAELGSSGAYRHSATLASNDPVRRRVTLAVNGRIREGLTARPRRTTLRLRRGEAESLRFQVAAEGVDFQIARVELEDLQLAEAFTFEHRPLTPDETQNGKVHGHEVTVHIAPELVPGTYLQTINVYTNQMQQTAAVRHVVELHVAGEVSIGGGQGWSTHLGVLSLGQLDRQHGAQTRLYFLLRGPLREKLTLTPKELLPADLQVKVGTAAPIGDGDVWRLPVDVMVPKGAKPINLMLTAERRRQSIGRIVFSTSHPDEPEILVPVSISIVE